MNRCKNSQLFLTINLEGRGLLGGGGGNSVVVFCFKIAESILTHCACDSILQSVAGCEWSRWNISVLVSCTLSDISDCPVWWWWSNYNVALPLPLPCVYDTTTISIYSPAGSQAGQGRLLDSVLKPYGEHC